MIGALAKFTSVSLIAGSGSGNVSNGSLPWNGSACFAGLAFCCFSVPFFLDDLTGGLFANGLNELTSCILWFELTDKHMYCRVNS